MSDCVVGWKTWCPEFDLVKVAVRDRTLSAACESSSDTQPSGCTYPPISRLCREVSGFQRFAAEVGRKDLFIKGLAV